MDSMWKRRQDPTCVAQIDALEQRLKTMGDRITELEKTYNDRLNAFEALVGTIGGENASLKEEIAKRHKVLSDDLDSMENRLMTRIEEAEDLAKPAEASSNDGEDKEVSGGHVRWSDRKRQAREAVSDSSVFTKPYQLKTRKTVPEPAAPTKEQ